MAKSIEKLADEIYKECMADGEPVTKEQALEMAQMELGAKENKNYTQAEPKKVIKAPKERKVDTEKLNILTEVKKVVAEMGATNITLKTETEVSFSYGENEYTLKLTKHRPPKK